MMEKLTLKEWLLKVDCVTDMRSVVDEINLHHKVKEAIADERRRLQKANLMYKLRKKKQ